MKGLIKVRQQYSVFGRGNINFLHPANQKVLAYTLDYGDQHVLIVNNLSRFSQPCELDLSHYNGWTPVEMLGNVTFPRIGDLPYFITLGPHAFYWFRLEKGEQS
jgi:maltose alpha-D-glucosyltransferase/alpha-amylase